MGPGGPEEECMSELDDARARLAQLEAQERIDARAREQARRDALKRVPVVYHVKPMRYHRFFKDGDVDGASVTMSYEPGALAAFEAEFGPADPDDRRFKGMFYYVTPEGILTHDGGGHYVLDTPRLITPKQWEQILAGDVPKTFRLY
jgi:hypothetical protein